MNVDFWQCKCGRHNAPGRNACKCGAEKREWTTDGSHIVPVAKAPQKTKKPRQTGKSSDFATAQDQEGDGKPLFVSTMKGKTK